MTSSEVWISLFDCIMRGFLVQQLLIQFSYLKDIMNSQHFHMLEKCLSERNSFSLITKYVTWNSRHRCCLQSYSKLKCFQWHDSVNDSEFKSEFVNVKSKIVFVMSCTKQQEESRMWLMALRENWWNVCNDDRCRWFYRCWWCVSRLNKNSSCLCCNQKN